MACELPAKHDRPLGRFSRTELHRLVIERGVTEASASTIWRWLHGRSLKPWRQQGSWLFPRDPRLPEPKAGRVLDLYAGRWEGRPLDPADCVISADEKTQHPGARAPPRDRPGRAGPPGAVEHEYARGGALAYLAAWDVRRAGVIGRCEATTGIAPFDRLVDQVMAQEPYRVGPARLLDRRQRQQPRGATLAARLPGRLSEPAPRPSAGPRLLAQPNRDLLLDPAAQGTHPERLPRPRRARRPDHGLRKGLPPDRRAVSLDPSPARQARRAARPTRRPRAAAGLRRLTLRRQQHPRRRSRHPRAHRGRLDHTRAQQLPRPAGQIDQRDRRQQPTASASIAHRDHRPRKPRALHRRVELVKHLIEHRLASELVILGDRLTQAAQCRRVQLRKLDLQRQIQTRQINQLGEQRRELALAQRSRPAPPPPAPRCARTPAPRLSSDGPRATPQQPAEPFRPLPHEHSALRPILAIAASSRQHRSEPAPATRRTYGRLY